MTITKLLKFLLCWPVFDKVNWKAEMQKNYTFVYDFSILLVILNKKSLGMAETIFSRDF